MPNSSTGSKVTVIIPNCNGLNWLDGCLAALGAQNMAAFHTIVVDDGSTDGSVSFIKENHPQIEIVELARNTGFANAVNIGIERAKTPYVALLNTDTRVYPDWLSSLVELIEISPCDVAAIGAQLLRMDDPERIDDAGDELSWYGAAVKRGHNEATTAYQEQEEIFSPCAAACLYRRDFLVKTGGFDAGFFAYLEDVDLGLRGRLLGYRYIYLPKAKVLHKGHGTGLAHGRYVEMITRNRLSLFAKNIPARLLLRHAAKLLYGQIYFMVLYRRPWSSIKGYLSFFLELPSIIPTRRRILAGISLPLDRIDALLHKHAPAPSLRDLACDRMFKAIGW